MTTMQTDIEPGDVVEVSTRRVGEPGRIGEIVAVFVEAGARHYRVRWEDGHESVFYPGETTTVRKAGGRSAPPRSKVPQPTAAHGLVELLRAADVQFELLPHPRTTRAALEADALGVSPQTVAKTVVARDDEGRCVRAVVPASTRLDLERLRGAVGAKTVRLLSETDLLSSYPQFELGAVPPFGGPAGDRVVVDNGLMAADHVVCEAGVHDVSVRIPTESLVALVAAEVAAIAGD